MTGLARVDTVGVTVPVDGWDTVGATAMVSQSGTAEETTTWRRRLPEGGFLATGIGRVAWLEASLPKRRGGDNVEGVQVDDVPAMVREMVEEASAWITLTPGVPWERWRVRRLDLVRDFDGVDIPNTLSALSTVVQRGNGVKVQRWADGESGGAETLRIGTRSSWAVRLYDKFAESGGIAPRGRLRFEAQLREAACGSEWLRSARLSRPTYRRSGRVVRTVELGDVLPERCDIALRVAFDRVGAGRELRGATSFAARLNGVSSVVVNGEAVEVTPRLRRELVAFLAARALGVELEWSRNTELRYSRICAALGIHLTSEDIEAWSRLDLDLGVQVTGLSSGESEGF